MVRNKAMRPLDLSEFLQWLYMHACRYPGTLCDGATGFALEALEQHENDCTAEYWELRGDLETQAGQEFEEDRKLVDYFVDCRDLLSEIDEKLEEFKFPDEFRGSDACDKVEYLLALVGDLQTEIEALKAPAVVLADGTALEFDL
jgi:hypothetical protein